MTEPQSVIIQKETPPNYKNKIIIKEEETVAPSAIALPERKFKFRTPDLVNDLPSQKEIESSPSFTKTIDDSVQESTTIRATD